VSSAQDAARHLMESYDIAVVPLDSATRSYLRFSALYRPHDLERLAGLRQQLQTG
jgi:hypothetical protein